MSRALWGSQGVVEECVVELGRSLVARGWRIRFIPVWPNDMPTILRAASRIGRRVEIFDRYLDLNACLTAIRECEVFVGMKLHSVVLASCVYSPSVMLEYQPKCRDFQRSIGREDYTIRTDAIDVDQLVGMVEELAENRDAHRLHLFTEVSRLRESLVAQAGWIARLVGARADGGRPPI